MELYQYAVIHTGPQNKSKIDFEPSIVVAPTWVLANNEAEVNVIAARAIPADFAKKLSEVSIEVRPFS